MLSDHSDCSAFLACSVLKYPNLFVGSNYLSSVTRLEKTDNKFLADMSSWRCTSVEYTHFTNGYLLTALTVAWVCLCQILIVILERYILQVRHLCY